MADKQMVARGIGVRDYERPSPVRPHPCWRIVGRYCYTCALQERNAEVRNMTTTYTVYATVELSGEVPNSEALIDVVQHALEHETKGIARHITLTARGGAQPIAVRIRPVQRDHSPCWSGF